MNKPVWILFDVGGVLLDWRRSSAALADTLNVTHDHILDTMFKYAPEMNIGTVDPLIGWQYILDDLKSNMSPQDAIRLWRGRSFWLDETLELVRDLHEADYRLGILSNSWLGLCIDGSADTMPTEMSLFSVLLDSSVEKLKKPNPAFYELAENKIGDNGENILFIDDDEPNLTPATEREWQTYLFDMGPEGIGTDAVAGLRIRLL